MAEPTKESARLLLLEILHFAALYAVVKVLFATLAIHTQHGSALSNAFGFLGF